MQAIRRQILFLALSAHAVCAHFSLLQPTSWFDANGKVGTAAGKQCSASCTHNKAPGEIESSQHCACQWYTNWTFVDAPTIPRDSHLRTYNDLDADGTPLPAPYADWTCSGATVYPPTRDAPIRDCTKVPCCRPWRAPGRALVNSPCGVDGGNPNGCLDVRGRKVPFGRGCAAGGYGGGPDARTMQFPGVVRTTWQAGAVVEAAWAITANHGGGYSYRLCPKPILGNAALTEACFEKTVLRAADDVHTAVFANGTRATFPAVRTTNGTYPVGSQWTRNPIPACGGPGGGSLAASGDVCKGSQFPPPLDDDELKGFGNDNRGGGIFRWHVVDRLQVPADLAPGKYVLSHRWDCEQTPQVWFTCSDIDVVKDAPPSPPAPSPAPPPPTPSPAPPPSSTCHAHCSSLGCAQGGGDSCASCVAKNRNALQGECWAYPCPDTKCFSSFRNAYCGSP